MPTLQVCVRDHRRIQGRTGGQPRVRASFLPHPDPRHWPAGVQVEDFVDAYERSTPGSRQVLTGIQRFLYGICS